MKKSILIAMVSILAVLALAACGVTNVSNTVVQPRTVTAAGTGDVYLAPDVAYINVGVRVTGDKVSDALAANNVQAQAISEALTALGVDKKDIQTSNFNVYPMQDYAPDGTVSRSYFVVENTVNVTVRDLAKLGSLLDTVVSSGANTINGITFDVLDKAAAEAQARDMAIAAAKTEAQGIAAAAGVQLGDLQSVNVASNGVVIPMFDARGGAGAASSSSVPISAGQLKVSMSANLVYLIK